MDQELKKSDDVPSKIANARYEQILREKEYIEDLKNKILQYNCELYSLQNKVNRISNLKDYVLTRISIRLGVVFVVSGLLKPAVPSHVEKCFPLIILGLSFNELFGFYLDIKDEINIYLNNPIKNLDFEINKVIEKISVEKSFYEIIKSSHNNLDDADLDNINEYNNKQYNKKIK